MGVLHLVLCLLLPALITVQAAGQLVDISKIKVCGINGGPPPIGAAKFLRHMQSHIEKISTTSWISAWTDEPVDDWLFLLGSISYCICQFSQHAIIVAYVHFKQKLVNHYSDWINIMKRTDRLGPLCSTYRRRARAVPTSCSSQLIPAVFVMGWEG